MVQAPNKIPNTPARWSLERYHAAVNAGIFEGWSVELLNGVIVDMSPEGPLHSSDICDVDDYLRTLVPRELGRFRLGNPLTLKYSEPEPDIAIVKPGSYREQHPGLKDVLLVIEFSNSSLARDTTGDKYQTYALEGIPDYWVLNLKDRCLRVNRQPDSAGMRYLEQFDLTSGTLKPLLLDIQVDVAQLLIK
ncbi:MAG: Uma2 family endonuclease [Cyanothece sp. SIO1E1]|nr:Uma2 family endonuclease [Cyanothece sp. SIO1E1]